ncbi:MAG: hypothetical protein AAFU71_05355 [Cyanobacteria bacterium J06632_22]
MPKLRTRPHAKSPNPFVRRVLQPLGRLVQGPYGIAAIASISFHGVVFALGPAMSGVSIAAFGDGPGDGSERTVPLVELSAAEQGRLPDFSNRRTFSGRVPVPSTTPPSLPLQRTPQRSRLSTVPQRSTGLRRSSPSTLNRQRQQQNSSRTPYVWDGSTRISRIPLPPSLAGQGLPEPRNSNPPPQQPESDPDTAASTATTGPETAPDNPTPDTPPEGTGTDLSLEGLQNPPSVEANGEAEGANTGETPPDNNPNNNPNNNPGEGSEPSDITANNNPDPEQARLQALRDSLEWDATGTAADPTDISDWVTSLQEIDDTIATAEARQGIDSNIRVCVDNPPADAIVGILVQPDGTLADTQLIQRTGYATTDQAALNAALAVVAPSEVPTAYKVDVSVGYDAEACVNPDTVLE